MTQSVNTSLRLGFCRYRYNTGIYTGTGTVFWVPVFFVKYRKYRYFPVFFFILASLLLTLFSRLHAGRSNDSWSNLLPSVGIEVGLQVRPTSIDSERCFSVCNRIISPTRTRLSDSKFYTLVFIYENRNFYWNN